MTDEQILQMLDLLHTMQDACLELYANIEADDTMQFLKLCGDMEAGLDLILNIIEAEDSTGNQKLRPACLSVRDSLQRVRNYGPIDRAHCLRKIEFELLPLLQEAYLTYYFWGYLSRHPDHLDEYYAKERKILCANTYVDDAIRSGRFKYDVSLYVLAYNKLEYTKMCVESLLANIPAGLNYELILVNHGSCDGTKEYFERIHPHKQLDIAVNGGGMGAIARIIEGEFSVHISNDVIITPYTIENLLTCIRSDPQIAWVVPTTPNVSNLQTIYSNYSTEKDMVDFSRKNNQSDSFRWEQRVRLCNPLDIYRNSVFYSSAGPCVNGIYHTFHPVHGESFPDDRLSLLLRRGGYKMMLAKDAYCHHFGSVTLKDEIQRQNEQQYYLEGRREFYRAFGVDPWGTGFCFDQVFLDRVVGEDRGHTEILGINCGLGSNSLKIKEQLKEYCRNTDVCLSNITDDPRFLADLKGISDAAQTVSAIKDLKMFLRDRTFQYIVWETPFLTRYKFRTVLECCLKALAPGGTLLIKRNDQSRDGILRDFPKRKELGNDWVVCRRGEPE